MLKAYILYCVNWIGANRFCSHIWILGGPIWPYTSAHHGGTAGHTMIGELQQGLLWIAVQLLCSLNLSTEQR